MCAATLLPLRLAHVALRCPSLARHSLSLAIADAHTGQDVPQYTYLCDLARNLGLLDVGQPDEDWIKKQDEANKRELARLDGELRGYKNNLIRESTRMGQEDLATHHLLTGGPLPDPENPQSASSAGYNAAYQAFSKMRDYCTTPTHVAGMTLRLAYTALVAAVSQQQLGAASGTHWNGVLANAGRLRSVGVKDEEQAKLTPIATVLSGLAHLSLSEYRHAMTAFLATPFDFATLGVVHGSDFGRVVASANDLAIYGGLCALAVCDRQYLIDHVLGGSFRAFLELEPHMRKAITLFTTAKYQACLALLQHYYSDWSVDIFLGAPASHAHLSDGSHVDRLFARVREKSIIAYFSSFSYVSLASLAQTFPPTTSSPMAMEMEVLSMIESRQLDARLDVVNGILIAPHKEMRKDTHTEAKRVADELERTLLLRLHKTNIVLAGLEIPRKPGPGGWEGGISVGNGGY